MNPSAVRLRSETNWMKRWLPSEKIGLKNNNKITEQPSFADGDHELSAGVAPLSNCAVTIETIMRYIHLKFDQSELEV